MAYDALVIASGSRLHAPIEGAELPGVLDFKSLRKAEVLVARVRNGEARNALIVGHGFIGVELALMLSDLGVDGDGGGPSAVGHAPRPGPSHLGCGPPRARALVASS